MKNILTILLILLSFTTLSYEKDTILNHLSDSAGTDYMVKVYQEKSKEGYLFKMSIVNPDVQVNLDLTPDEYVKYKDVKTAKIDKKYLAPKVYTDFEIFIVFVIIIIIVIAVILTIIFCPQVIGDILSNMHF
jgi:nitrogen fixation/metabolism regulation signal transduction histidine kinase